jgi:hypothetical protein
MGLGILGKLGSGYDCIYLQARQFVSFPFTRRYSYQITDNIFGAEFSGARADCAFVPLFCSNRAIFE